MLTSYLLPGVDVSDFFSALFFAALLALLNATVKPLLIIFTLPLTVFTLGLFLLVINAVVILMADDFIPPSQQKRGTARMAVTIQGNYKLKGTKDWLPCEIIDVGTGGLQIRGQFSFYAGDEVDVKFFLEEKVMISQIEITNISGRKAGGKYLAINDSDANIIQEFIHKSIIS